MYHICSYYFMIFYDHFKEFCCHWVHSMIFTMSTRMCLDRFRSAGRNDLVQCQKMYKTWRKTEDSENGLSPTFPIGKYIRFSTWNLENTPFGMMIGPCGMGPLLKCRFWSSFLGRSMWNFRLVTWKLLGWISTKHHKSITQSNSLLVKSG